MIDQRKDVAVIWDMDGLLLDSERVSYRAWKAAALEQGIEFEPALFHKIVGMNHPTIQATLQSDIGHLLDVATLGRRSWEIYEGFIEEGVPLKPGAAACLERVSERGLLQALVTSSTRRYAEKKLGHHGLLKHLNELVSGDQVTRGKPDPEPFLLAAERLGVPPEGCVVFEDSVNGILGAQRAGMRPILVPDLVQHPEESLRRCWKVLDSLEQALPILAVL